MRLPRPNWLRAGAVAATFLALLLALLLARSTTPFGQAVDRLFTDAPDGTLDNTSDSASDKATINTQALSSPPVLQKIAAQPVNFQDSYTHKRQYFGWVEAQQVATVAFEVSGTLDQIWVDEGDRVQQNTTLAQLNRDRLTALSAEAQARLKQAESDANLARITHERITKVRQANAVSAQVKDEALKARDTTAAAVGVAQARLNTALVNLDKTTLLAPFEGTVIKRLHDVGAVVNSGTPLLHIQSTGAYRVRVGITHRAAQNLTIGQIKRLRINANAQDAPRAQGDASYDASYDASGDASDDIANTSNAISAKIIALLPVRTNTQTIDLLLEIIEHGHSVVGVDKGSNYDSNGTATHTATHTPVRPNIRPGDVARLTLEHRVAQRGFWVPLTALTEGKRGLWSLYVSTKMPAAEAEDFGLTAPPGESVHVVEQRVVEIHHLDAGRAFVSGAVGPQDLIVHRGVSKLVPNQKVRL